jgi:scyllo-inositol 2-dehydrogenase (NADP+)
MKKFKKAGEIKCGVIGYGAAFNISRQHLTEMKRAGMVPTAVTDPDKARLKVAEQEFPGIQTYTSAAQMLRKADLNMVVVCTPHNTHTKLALSALRAGCSVVCEKPLAITTAECDAMIREAKKRSLVLSTYHNRHWDGWIMHAVKEIKKGAIGEVYRIEAHMGGYSKPGPSWRASKSISGGIMYDWGVHLLEYSLQIMDGKMTEVSGYMTTGNWCKVSPWKKDANEDEGYAVVRFDNGKRLTLTSTSLDMNQKRGMLEITGTKGTYIMDGSGYEVITLNAKGEKVVRTGINPQSESYRFYQNVSDHMVKGTPLVITPEWARRPIHILDLADRSARQGRALKTKYS